MVSVLSYNPNILLYLIYSDSTSNNLFSSLAGKTETFEDVMTMLFFQGSNTCKKKVFYGIMLIALGKAGILGQPYLILKVQSLKIVVMMTQQGSSGDGKGIGAPGSFCLPILGIYWQFSNSYLSLHLNRHRYPPQD